MYVQKIRKKWKRRKQVIEKIDEKMLKNIDFIAKYCDSNL